MPHTASRNTKARNCLLLAAVALMPQGCIMWASCGIDALPLSRNALPETVKSAVRARVADGSTIVYRDGVSVTKSVIAPRDRATRYDVHFVATGASTTIPLDSIVALEVYKPRIDAVGSALGTGAVVGVLLWLFVSMAGDY